MILFSALQNEKVVQEKRGEIEKPESIPAAWLVDNFLSFPTLEMTSVKRDFLTFTAHQKPTVGDTKISVVGIDHMGWLLCDGRLLNTKDWTFLFNVIGYQFGGSNAQFALPDPAGRVTGIAGAGTGLTPRSIGDSVGTEIHTLTIAEMPSHNHGTDASDSVVGNNLTGLSTTKITVNSNTTGITTNTNAPITGLVTRTGNNTGTAFDSSPGELDLINATNLTLTDPGHTHTITDPAHQHSIATQGSDQPHNNVQPTLFVGNLFIYSGKVNYGNYPYTAGYYGTPATTALYSNIL